MKWLGCLMGLGFYVGLAMQGAGCGDLFSASGGTGGAGSGSSQNTGGTSSGTGGAQCAAGSCTKGEYCNPDTAACDACATSARFQFGTPVMQAVTLPIPGANALFPRIGSSAGELFLVQQDSTHHVQVAEALAAAGKSPPWGAAALLSQLAGSYQDTAPLYLEDSSILVALVSDDGVTKPGMPVVLFDSNRPVGSQMGTNKVFVVTLGSPAVGPVVVSLPGGAAHDSSVAVAMLASPPRFWWISDAGPALGDAAAPLSRLVTATAVDTGPTDVVLTLDDACTVPLVTAPWVTPAGDRLLFASARAPAGTCVVADPSLTHLYQAPIGPGGKQTADAKPIFPDDVTVETEPSLAPDQCTLLFSRVVDSAGTTRIFTAARD